MNIRIHSCLMQVVCAFFLAGCQTTSTDSPPRMEPEQVNSFLRRGQEGSEPAFRDGVRCKKVFLEFPEEEIDLSISLSQSIRTEILSQTRHKFDLIDQGKQLIMESVDLSKCHFSGRFKKLGMETRFHLQAWEVSESKTLFGNLQMELCSTENCPSDLTFMYFENGKFVPTESSLIPRFSTHDFWPKIDPELALAISNPLPILFSFSTAASGIKVTLNEISFLEENREVISGLVKPLELVLKWDSNRFMVSPLPM